ncbi:MAG: hypothetical protein C0484_18735 [Rhodospirillum sp.]|nr:hypothetical protein [Rhodospirillum sp.]
MRQNMENGQSTVWVLSNEASPDIEKFTVLMPGNQSVEKFLTAKVPDVRFPYIYVPSMRTFHPKGKMRSVAIIDPPIRIVCLYPIELAQGGWRQIRWRYSLEQQQALKHFSIPCTLKSNDVIR